MFLQINIHIDINLKRNVLHIFYVLSHVIPILEILKIQYIKY